MLSTHPYIERSLASPLLRALAAFPGVILTGPRQSGKTTLLRKLLHDTHRYVTLDDLVVREHALADPADFLRTHRPPLVIDEIQYAPELLSAIKLDIDEHRTETGRFVVTGSQDLLMLRQVSETLAGRVAVLRLLPFSRRELDGHPDLPLAWERDESGANDHADTDADTDFWQAALRGGYPEAARLDDDMRTTWFDSYVQTYLERDVRIVRDVGSLIEFRAFLQAVASRSGQLLDLSGLARDLGISVNTAKAWLSVLDATYQVRIVPPFHANLGKRLTKRPKVVFADTGLLCHLTGIRTPEQARSGPLAGAIAETAVAIEITRTLAHRGRQPELHHWRTSNGAEVDLLVRDGVEHVPVETKSGTWRPGVPRALRDLLRSAAPVSRTGWIVHVDAAQRRILAENVAAIPFTHL